MSEAFDDDFLDAEAPARERPHSKFDGLADDDPRLQMKLAMNAHVGCATPTYFIRRRDKAIIMPRAFNMKYNRIVNAIPNYIESADEKKKVARYMDNAAAFAIASNALAVVDGICYQPGGPELADDLYNTWKRPEIEPLDETPATFLKHMAYLIPDARERKLVLDWFAWVIRHPTEKLLFALLIVGRGGTGKSWLGNLMRILLGRNNAKLLERDTPLKGRFNSWLESKQLVFVHELVPDGKDDLIDTVKGIITEETVNVERKGVDIAELPNLANLACISNHPDRIKMLRTDRRWAVVRAADDPVGVNDRGEQTDEFVRYYSHLFECIGTPDAPGDEARRVLHYLQSVHDLTGFNGRGLAPVTGTKEDVAAGGEDSIQAQVANMHREHAGPFAYTLLTSAEVMASIVLPSVRYDEDVKRLQADVTAAMQEAGCRQVRIKAADGTLRTPQLRVVKGDPPVRLWAVSSKLATRFESLSAAELVATYRAQREADALG